MPASGSHHNALTQVATAARERLVSAFSSLGLALGSIFFIPRGWIGLVLWLALLRDLRNAGFALLGLVTGAAIKRMLRVSESPGLGGGVKANALLAAIVMGWMTEPQAMPLHQELLLAAAAAASAALVAAAVMRVLSRSVLPALLWGYCLVAAMLFTVCPQCTVLANNAMPAWPAPTDTPGWVSSFLRSMGSLMYSADVVAGVFVVLAILLWSRTMLICGMVGWACGVIVAIGFEGLQLVYDWRPISYNYFIAGMALGAVVFVPGRASLPVAAVAGSVTAFLGLALQYGLDWSAISYLPVPAGLATWVGIGALTLAGDQSPVVRSTAKDLAPEEQWWQLAFWTARFGTYAPLFAVPLEGAARISQGFSGKLSHRGLFRHALDLQRPHSPEASASSIWGAAVTSPVPGTVERVRDTVADNAPGVCNYADVWGNYVVIRMDVGGWALLGHLQRGSIAVAVGERVEAGTYLGRVGNSGRSSVPHLHVHLQDGPEPGAPTKFFRLANYQYATQPRGPLRAWKAAAIPAEGDVVMAAARNPPVYLALTGIVPGATVWVAESVGRIPRAFRPRVPGRHTHHVDIVLDSLGQHVFETAGEGKLIARLDPDAWRVVELSRATSPLLKLLALAAPCVPYAAKAGMAWIDLSPTEPPGGWLRPLALLLAPYLHRPFHRLACTCVSEPGPQGAVLEVTSHLEKRSRALPLKLSCQFATYRGPVKVRAEFEHGSVIFSLLSHEPGARSQASQDASV